MPEVTRDASFLIATSWQALGRAETEDERTTITNCTVAIVFAGFFIEANLNHLIENMDIKEKVKAFAKPSNPGLSSKLAWLHNNLIAKPGLFDKDAIYEAMHLDFPEFKEIKDFRNNVAHGEIDRSKANLKDARRLRLAAKEIVERLLQAAEEAGYKVNRGVTYQMAITSTDLT